MLSFVISFEQIRQDGMMDDGDYGSFVKRVGAVEKSPRLLTV